MSGAKKSPFSPVNCLDKYGKSTFVELTEAEMLDLVNYMESWN
ncbi:hypothetical protein D082_13270 [Synechocystis sp. PCC 6714]|nr:hypothetical protein D082_13270 [Synechocystis sp. PCC 6714]